MPKFEGVVGRTLDESTPWWPDPVRAPDGAPNVVMVLLDDVGYAQFGCYGCDIATPTFDRLAADGLRYSQLPHDRAVLADPGLPAHRAQPPHQRHGPHRRVRRRLPRLQRDDPARERLPVRDPRAQRLRHVRGRQVAPHAGRRHDDGRARATAGRSAAASSASTASSPARPTSSTPTSSTTTTRSTRPRSPEEGYHLTEDLADKAILFIKDLRAVDATKPFFLYFTPGACHAPHQAPAAFIDRYRGRFDHGWDAWRERGVRPPARVGPAPGRHAAQRAAVVDPGVGRRARPTSAGCTRG